LAFTVTIIKKGIIGDLEYVIGKYVNDSGSTGGELTTGLSNVDNLVLQEKGSSVSSDRSVVNEDFPLAKGDVTIVTSSNETGTFTAWGNGN